LILFGYLINLWNWKLKIWSKYNLQRTLSCAAFCDSAAPIWFSRTQEYLPVSALLADLITREGWSTLAPSYRVLLLTSSNWPLRYLRANQIFFSSSTKKKF
jgi:hypothetical protein